LPIVAEVVGVLQERLADTRDVAVAEDPEATREEPPLVAVPFAVLRRQEADQGLSYGEPHARPSAEVSGSRGSTGCPGQVSRIQACAGSSQMRQARSGDGPAITFR